jgi:hypothetical protein
MPQRRGSLKRPAAVCGRVRKIYFRNWVRCIRQPRWARAGGLGIVLCPYDTATQHPAENSRKPAKHAFC